jgi:hypothetical protein
MPAALTEIVALRASLETKLESTDDAVASAGKLDAVSVK